MVEKRVSKTPDQIRAEAAIAAQADMLALTVHPSDYGGRQCGCKSCMSLYGQQFRWHWERIEREATTWYSMGMPISEQAAQQYPGLTSWPVPVRVVLDPPPHVCEPNEGSGIRSCKSCGRVLDDWKPIVTVGP